MALCSARRFPVLSLLALVLGGCSSDPLGGQDAGDDTSAGAGGETSAGAGGDAGAGGGTAGTPEVPDFTSSDCYGEPAETLVYDIETHATERRGATCRGETERVRLYVDDALFSEKVSQGDVNAFLHRYELSGGPGSAHPGLGVLATNEAVFGAVEPSLLAGDKLPIFVVDTNRSGAGYLCDWCEGLELHLDGLQLAPLGGDTALSIAAHETFHLLHAGFDPNEEPWIDESLAQAAMSVNGFFSDRALLNGFARQPNVNWGPAAELREFDYGAGLAFGTYLWEFGGEELMRAATANGANGWAGLDAALTSVGHGETAFELFLRMAIALYLDAPERGYGFRSFDLVQGVGISSESSGSVEPYGLVYYLPSEQSSSLRVEGADSLRALLFSDAEPVEVLDLALGDDTPLFSNSVVVVTNASRAAVSYSLSER